MPAQRRKTAFADIANGVTCANGDCGHLASAHQDTAQGNNTGSCTMKGCDCSGMKTGAAASSGGRQFAPGDPAAPDPPAGPSQTPAPTPSANTDAGENDPANLASAVDAALDAGLGMLVGVDVSTLPPAVQQAVALFRAADATVDDLLEVMAVPDPDEMPDDSMAASAYVLTAAGSARFADADPQALIDWFEGGADGQIAWCSSGDVDDCVAVAGEYLADPDGFCNDRQAAVCSDGPNDDAEDNTPDVDAPPAPAPAKAAPKAAATGRARSFADGKGVDASGQENVQSSPGPEDPSAPGGPAEQQTFEMPIMVIEGVDTGDGRFITPNCLTWRDLPLPVMAITKTTMGHDDAELVGRLDTIERVDISAETNPKTGEPYGEGVTALKATGVFSSSDEASRVADLIHNEFLRGVSVDIGDVKSTVELLDENGEPTSGEDEGDDFWLFLDGDIRETLTSGRVMGVTICPFPAFEGAFIRLNDGFETPITREEQGDGAPVPEPTVASVVNVDQFGTRECVPCQNGGPLVASAGPVAPPAEWFSNPQCDGPTPLTITDDGRIYGHLATWGVCHTGVSGRCVTAPRSTSDYAYFRTGAVQCADGTLVSTGPITLGGGHASLPLGAQEAIRHYDEAGYAVADVAAGEDRYGIWVAGAMRPDVTPEQVRSLRASALSGDWRQVGGRLELVAALAVNAPGFPVVRAQVASGYTQALVAAGGRQVILAAQERAASDRAMLSAMREQWPLVASILAERDAKAAKMRAEVRAGGLRADVHRRARR